MLIPLISPFTVYSVVPPFIFIILVALIREAVEDSRRYKNDREFNKSP